MDDEDPDNPFWTAADWARARPASEVLPPHIARMLVKQQSDLLGVQLSQQSLLARDLGLAA